MAEKPIRASRDTQFSVDASSSRNDGCYIYLMVALPVHVLLAVVNCSMDRIGHLPEQLGRESLVPWRMIPVVATTVLLSFTLTASPTVRKYRQGLWWKTAQSITLLVPHASYSLHDKVPNPYDDQPSPQSVEAFPHAVQSVASSDANHISNV